jgi:hypothetical protein
LKERKKNTLDNNHAKKPKAKQNCVLFYFNFKNTGLKIYFLRQSSVADALENMPT